MVELTAGALAAQLGLPFRGDAAKLITGAAVLEDASPEQLAFIGAPKFFEAGLKSRAGCVIAPPPYPRADGQTVIESARPRAHFAAALALPSARAHRSAKTCA
jgi:UDP-3-O-[3-hydroxymyristoyl] glucosamine N-acyltransferase